MRRTEQEFKAEILRRSSAFKARRRKKIRNLLVSFSCLALLLSVQQVLSQGFGGSSAEAADEAVEYFAVNQAPAAAEEPESIQLEPMEVPEEYSDTAYGTSTSGQTEASQIILQPEDYVVMDTIEDLAYWKEDNRDCVMDVIIIRGEISYRFSTGCGTLCNEQTGMTAELSQEAIAELMALIGKYQ